MFTFFFWFKRHKQKKKVNRKKKTRLRLFLSIYDLIKIPLLYFASLRQVFRFTSLSLHIALATSGTLSQIGNSMQICSAECFASPYAKYAHSLNSGKNGVNNIA